MVGQSCLQKTKISAGARAFGPGTTFLLSKFCQPDANGIETTSTLTTPTRQYRSLHPLQAHHSSCYQFGLLFSCCGARPAEVMAWQQPRSLLRAVRSTCTSSNTSSWAKTSIAARVGSSQQFSTSASKKSVVAAAPLPENDQDGVLLRAGTPARIIPVSPSYFTSSPRFTDSLLRLEHLQRKYELLPTVPAEQAPHNFWLKLGQYKGQVGERVTPSKYQKVLNILQRLNKIHPDLMPEDAQAALREFIRPGSELRNIAQLKKPDEHGRAKAIGRRKEASARVYLVEGDGQVLINERNITEMFPRLHDRESVLWPLKVTQRIDKYNVWALSQGGGITGQAESITLALARALVMHEPALKPVLRRGKLSNHYEGTTPSTPVVASLSRESANNNYSWCHHKRCSSRGKEEARPCQGQENAPVGQALSRANQILYTSSFSCTILYHRRLGAADWAAFTLLPIYTIFTQSIGWLCGIRSITQDDYLTLLAAQRGASRASP